MPIDGGDASASRDTPSPGHGKSEVIEIPCPKESLGQFISDLLGRPQSLRKHILCNFEIDVNYINNIDALIKQRVSQQNAFYLISTTFSIYLDNGFSRTLHSLDEFMSYNEIKKSPCLAMNVSWVLLITFPHSKIPEKQTITIKINTGSLPLARNASFQYGSSLFFLPICGTVSIEIFYTERTWADDVEAMLSSYIASNVNVISNFRLSLWSFSTKYLPVIMLISIPLSFLFAMVVTVRGSAQRYADMWGKVASLGEKVDVLYSLGIDRLTKDFSALFLVFPVIIFMFFSSIKYVLNRVPSSHVLITSASCERRDIKRKWEKVSLVGAILSFVLSVCAGIFANNIRELSGIIGF